LTAAHRLPILALTQHFQAEPHKPRAQTHHAACNQQ
jgi:hypothetical protein